MNGEPLLHWPDPLVELLTFVAAFLAIGAVGFRWRVLAGLSRSTRDATERKVSSDAAARAAMLGLVGATISFIVFLTRLPEQAARQHTTVGQLLATTPRTDFQLTMLLAVMLGLALATRRIAFGWVLAAVGVVAGPLTSGFFGQWNRVVVPVHRLAAGAWIGTLFMLVAVGLTSVLRAALPSERRGALAAAMVNAFSPLALVSAAVLALFGVVTAWQHLHRIESLWTTPYGIALDVKLALVGVVLGLGAWNWRRQKPLLGSEAGARNLIGTASSELIAAALVLIATAILVSLPSPKA